MKIERVHVGDGMYAQACALRERDLLASPGLTLAKFHAMFPGVEESSEHMVAVEDGIVIGCVLLREDGQGAGVLSQMVVGSQHQGLGVGRGLVEALSERAFGALGLDSIWCHAREEAYGFYKKLGWEFESGEFEEAGILHRTMRILRDCWPGLLGRG